MVNRVVAPEALMSFALGWTRTLPKPPPRSIAAIKRAVYLGADRDLSSGLYVGRCEMRDLTCRENTRTFMGAYNQAVVQDPLT
jgi:enoyl-CoA hydratase/carnithine racemase